MRRVLAGALAAGLTIGAADAVAQASKYGPLPPAPPLIAHLTLPNGRLHLFTASGKAAAFVVLDDMARPRPGEATLVIYTVYDPGLPSRGRIAVQVVSRERFDCAAGVHQQVGAQAFDAHGALVIWTPADQPRPVANTGYEVLAKFACDGLALPVGEIFSGHSEALRAGQGMIQATKAKVGR